MIQELLKEGTISGFPFQFTDLNLSGGRKTVIHEFVGSDKVIGEDLGKSANRFALDIYVHGQGSDYFIKRDGLISALEEPQPISMTHPTFGDIRVFLDGDYSMDEDLTDLGRAVFTVRFVKVDNDIESFEDQIGFLRVAEDFEGNEIVSIDVSDLEESQKVTIEIGSGNNSVFNRTSQIPRVDPVTLSEELSNELFDLKNSVFYKSLKLINKGLEVYRNSQQAGFLQSAGSILQNISDVKDIFLDISDVFQGNEAYSEFIQRVNFLDFLNTGSSTVNGLSAIGYEFGKIFEFMENSISSPVDRYQSFSSFKDYNDDRTDTASQRQTTKENVQVYKNEKANRDYLQLLSLSFCCNALAEITFRTEDELSSFETDIISRLNKAIETHRDNSDIYNDLQAQKVIVNAQINKARTGLLKVIEVTVTNSSLINLVYDYYGDLRFYVTIRDLNGFRDPSNVNGTVKVLSNG